jgi:hypothetical protein
MAKSGKKTDDIELHDNAWARFERAVDAAVKSGPKHKITPKKRSKKKRAAK